MSRRRKITYWTVGILVGLTMLGSITSPPEPEVRTVYRTKVIYKKTDKPVFVSKPVFPAACKEVFRLAKDIGDSATEIADVVNPQLDIMHRAGKWIHTKDTQGLVDAGNEQRVLELKVAEARTKLFAAMPEYDAAESACRAAIKRA